MATKKSSSKRSTAKAAPASNNNDMWKWVYLLGIIVASIVGAIGYQNDVLTIVLAVVGFLVGIFFFDSDDVMNFGLRFLIATAAASALNVIPTVGPYITGFFTGFATFLGPIVLGMIIMNFWKKYFGNM